MKSANLGLFVLRHLECNVHQKLIIFTVVCKILHMVVPVRKNFANIHRSVFESFSSNN